MMKDLEKKLGHFEKKYGGSFNPDIILRLQLLRDQYGVAKDTVQLVKDILDIKWEDDNSAEILFESIRCYKELIKRNEEIANIIRVED